jgi:hypothetical protein
MATIKLTGKNVEQVVDPNLEGMLEELVEIRSNKNFWDTLEKPKSADARELVEGLLDETPADVYQVGNITVQPIISTRRSVSVEKLLDHGVDPVVIEACTTTSQSMSLRLEVGDGE